MMRDVNGIIKNPCNSRCSTIRKAVHLMFQSRSEETDPASPFALTMLELIYHLPCCGSVRKGHTTRFIAIGTTFSVREYLFWRST